MSFSKVPTLKLRAPHGIRNFSYQARMWNGVAVYHVTQYLDPGRCWQNLCTEQATVAVVLEQVGGYCEPRTRLNNPTPRSRYDAGHSMYIPPCVDVWGYGAASISSVRDIRMRFDYQVVERLLGDESDRKRWNEPLLLLYDDRLTQCADLLAKDIAEQDDDRPLHSTTIEVQSLPERAYTIPT